MTHFLTEEPLSQRERDKGFAIRSFNAGGAADHRTSEPRAGTCHALQSPFQRWRTLRKEGDAFLPPATFCLSCVHFTLLHVPGKRGRAKNPLVGLLAVVPGACMFAVAVSAAAVLLHGWYRVPHIVLADQAFLNCIFKEWPVIDGAGTCLRIRFGSRASMPPEMSCWAPVAAAPPRSQSGFCQRRKSQACITSGLKWRADAIVGGSVSSNRGGRRSWVEVSREAMEELADEDCSRRNIHVSGTGGILRGFAYGFM